MFSLNSSNWFNLTKDDLPECLLFYSKQSHQIRRVSSIETESIQPNSPEFKLSNENRSVVSTSWNLLWNQISFFVRPFELDRREYQRNSNRQNNRENRRSKGQEETRREEESKIELRIDQRERECLFVNSSERIQHTSSSSSTKTSSSAICSNSPILIHPLLIEMLLQCCDGSFKDVLAGFELLGFVCKQQTCSKGESLTLYYSPSLQKLGEGLNPLESFLSNRIVLLSIRPDRLPLYGHCTVDLYLSIEPSEESLRNQSNHHHPDGSANHQVIQNQLQSFPRFDSLNSSSSLPALIIRFGHRRFLPCLFSPIPKTCRFVAPPHGPGSVSISLLSIQNGQSETILQTFLQYATPLIPTLSNRLTSHTLSLLKREKIDELVGAAAATTSSLIPQRSDDVGQTSILSDTSVDSLWNLSQEFIWRQLGWGEDLLDLNCLWSSSEEEEEDHHERPERYHPALTEQLLKIHNAHIPPIRISHPNSSLMPNTMDDFSSIHS